MSYHMWQILFSQINFNQVRFTITITITITITLCVQSESFDQSNVIKYIFN